MPSLIVVQADDPALLNRVIPLEDDHFAIGRTPENTLRLSDNQVSRRHAAIHRGTEGWWLEDMRSANGTVLNGARIDKAWLQHGDRIEIGGVIFAFDDAIGAPQPEPTPPPPPPPAPLRASGSRVALWIAAGTVFASLAAAGLVWLGIHLVRGRGASPQEGQGGAEAAVEKPLTGLDYGIRPGTPIPVERVRKLASGKISTTAGGSLQAPGISVRFPAKCLPEDREISLYEVRVPPPANLSVSLAEGESAKPAELGLAFEVDAGSEAGLYSEDVRIAVDTTQVRAAGRQIVQPVISLDGKTWDSLPYTMEGDNLVFTTRHFSIIGAVITGVATGVALVSLVIFPDEFPSQFQEYAPFKRIGFLGNSKLDPVGLEIYYSLKMPGLDPGTGLMPYDVSAFEAGREAIRRRTMANNRLMNADPGSWPPDLAWDFRIEEARLKRSLIMPEQAVAVEKALDFARRYLEDKRKFRRPFCNLPVYIIPSFRGYDGYLHNPWSGRRYLVLPADLKPEVLSSATLHELFHHYQTGYVWIDRNGHLPFVEASALLMEREAEACYTAAGRPYSCQDGLMLAQYLGFRNSLKSGPDAWFWQEVPVRKFGYSLSWFLEYLRDRRFEIGGASPLCSADAGSLRVPLEAGDPLSFQRDILGAWASNRYNANFKALLWAAGDDERKLGEYFLDFARTRILKGDQETAQFGKSAPYWVKYVKSGNTSGPFQDSPYSKDATSEFGLTPALYDFSQTACTEIDDNLIKSWSIQFLKFRSPKRKNVELAAIVPREWFPKDRNQRGVFFREKASEEEVQELRDLDQAPLSSDYAATKMDFAEDAFIYVVDTGQTGSGYVRGFKPAKVFALEPPAELAAEVDRGKLVLTWKAPPAAQEGACAGAPEFRYFIYVNELKSRAMEPAVDRVNCRIEMKAEEIPSWAGHGIPRVAVSSAVEIGRNENGDPVYLESRPSDTVGGEPVGNYELSLDITAETPDAGSECAAMNHYWSFLRFTVTLQVQVGVDGRFRFSKEWSEPYIGDGKVRHVISGEGTFVADQLRIDGTFSSDADWRMNEHELSTKETGSFTGEGKFLMDQWFGHHLEGEFKSSLQDRYCATATNNECTEWKTEETSCQGRLPKLMSSIESFRKL
ncbi:MAG: FHA domain-containing protein [Acidobacteriota bacterium]